MICTHVEFPLVKNDSDHAKFMFLYFHDEDCQIIVF
jgi:hypothetical protein